MTRPQLKRPGAVPRSAPGASLRPRGQGWGEGRHSAPFSTQTASQIARETQKEKGRQLGRPLVLTHDLFSRRIHKVHPRASVASNRGVLIGRGFFRRPALHGLACVRATKQEGRTHNENGTTFDIYQARDRARTDAERSQHAKEKENRVPSLRTLGRTT
jgi:hypothetical protein